MNTDNWITAVLALRRAKSVVVFSGAGVSAESGIPTFRDAEGFWKRFPPERFATWNGLLQTALTEPRSLAEFVLNVVEPIAKATPNAAHAAITILQDQVPTTVVTQNIDGLHQVAGSNHILEIHGTLLEVVDSSNRQIVKHFQREDLMRIAEGLRRYVNKQMSLVSAGLELRRHYPFDWLGRHRPNLVLFGDALAEPAWSNACQAVETCDVLLSVGTSGVVYPAALLPDRAAANGATIITIDPQPATDCWLEGTAGKVLPDLIRAAFESG